MTSPGWYNDERDPRLARWHDGRGWTEHTMAKDAWPGPGSPPPPAETGPAAPTPTAAPPTGTAPAAAAPAPSGAPLGRGPVPPPAPVVEERSVPLMEARPPVARRRRPALGGASPHLVTAVASLVVVAICLLWLQRIDEEHDAEAAARSQTTTTTLPGASAEWTTADGSTYRLTATPGVRTSTQASTYGCLEAPATGRLNATFTIRVENTSINREAPVPQLAVGVNLGGDGAVDPGIVTLDAAATDVEIGPIAEGTSCSVARTVSSANGDAIPPGGWRELEGIVGGVPAPLPAGLQLIVRYFPADANPRGPGFVNADLVAPFPTVTPATGSD